MANTEVDVIRIKALELVIEKYKGVPRTSPEVMIKEAEAFVCFLYGEESNNNKE